jgi:hypothetical protein
MTAMAVSFAVCCARIGISVRTGKRRLAEVTFPIPELPRLTLRGPHKYSSVEIDRYLNEASLADARVRRRKTAA